MKIWIILLLLSCLFTTYVSGKCAFVTSWEDKDSFENFLVLGNTLTQVRNDTSIDRLLFYTTPPRVHEAELVKEIGNWTMKQYPEEYIYYSNRRRIVGLSYLFELDEYDRIVYLDSKLIILKNIDALCNDESQAVISAVFGEHIVNGDVFAITPNRDLAEATKIIEKTIDRYVKSLILTRLTSILGKYNLVFIGTNNTDINPSLPVVEKLPDEYDSLLSTYPNVKILRTGNWLFYPPSWFGFFFFPNLSEWWDQYAEIVKNNEQLFEAREYARYFLIFAIILSIFFRTHLAKIYKKLTLPRFLDLDRDLDFKPYFCFIRLKTLFFSILIADSVAYDLSYALSAFSGFNNLFMYITLWVFLGKDGRVASAFLLCAESIMVKYLIDFGHTTSYNARLYVFIIYNLAYNLICMFWVEHHFKSIRKAMQEERDQTTVSNNQ